MTQINRLTLDNGIRVVHTCDSATAMVALNVLVDTGARDERPDRTGLAHLMEHLMFGGSANVPDFDKAIEDAGGYNNAFTSSDFTNYYSVAPAQNAETLFWAESDRFLAPAFTASTIEVQRSVVIEEFKQTSLNRPYGDMSHLLRGLVYERHPYRWPVIGLTPDHIAATERNDILEFFETNYSPERLIVAVTGRISWDDCRRLATKWFGSIPARPAPRRNLPEEPAQTSPRQLTVQRQVPQTAITVAYPMAAYGHKGYREADIITDLLAAGRSSRFYRRLMLGTELFTEVDASIIGSEDPGYLMLNAKLRHNTDDDIAAALQLLTDEAGQLAIPGNITDEEMQRCRNRYESSFRFGLIDYLSLAQNIAMAEYHGLDINHTVDRYRAVSADDVAATAASLFRPENSNTLIYRPQA
ncbi:MAG: insulinase family protein [Muribaculaceae bacterium]|nr:insulinase family protein [Muribaculaceae bacterium]